MKIRDTIYLDHHSSTPVDERVLTAMAPYYRESFGNPHSVDHILGWQAHQAVEKASSQIASLLRCDSDEIVFTSGATEANNQAILGAAIVARGTDRNRIIVSSAEHKCLLESSRAAHELFGMAIEHAPVDRFGRVPLDWLKGTLDENVLLVSVIGVNNEIGTIQDIKPISDAAHSVGALVHSDCAQAPLATAMSEIAQHTDMLSLSAHKIYGPKGIGALFIERSAQKLISPLIFGGGQQRNLRSGTVPTHLVVGMGEASALLNGVDSLVERDRIRALRDRFISYLQDARIEITLITPTEIASHPANANVRFVGMNAQDILQCIQPRVAASSGSACTSGVPETSHVLRAIGLSEQEAEECIRFSVGRNTNEADIEEAVAVIADAVVGLSTATQPAVA
jgi:cysteine desulfurase